MPRAWPSASSLTPNVVIDDLPHLARLGNAIDAIDLVRERIGLNTSEVILADLKDVEFGMTLPLLDHILRGIGAEAVIIGINGSTV